MKRGEAIGLLRRHEPKIAAYGVRAPYLFGSTRRDEAGPDSDVGLFIDYDQGFSLLDLVAVKGADRSDPGRAGGLDDARRPSPRSSRRHPADAERVF